MPSPDVLIVYGTRYGQTAKVARRIADQLESRGFTATPLNGDALPPDLVLREFDGVIVGASVIRGRHQPYIGRLVRANRGALNAMPSAFFSVSGAAASRDEKERAEAQRILEKFLAETGWRPTMTRTVAGAMAFTRYGVLLRWFMKRISKRSGGPTDTSRDHELTDWADVARFVDEFAAAVRHSPESVLESTPA